MKNIEKLLIYSLDNELTEREQEQLNIALENSAELQEKRNKFMKMRKFVTDFEVSENANFSKKVLQKIRFIQKKKESFGANIVAMFPNVAAACIAILIVSLLAIQWTDINLSSEALVGVEDLNVEDAIAYFEN